MKKILSLIMVLALVLSLGIPAFAVENTGSITIKNATIGQVYELYRLFDANYSGDAVSYSLEKDSQFYPALFDDNGNPVAGNTFFTYNVDTKEVKKVKGVNDTDLINYVKEIIQNGNFETEVLPEEADSTTVSFDDIPFGYYVIDIDDAGGVITITSNTPDAEVIDKNQVPLTGGIEKQVWDADKGQWSDYNYAFVGDVVKYRVKFNATNYAGIEQIHYYSVHDLKGEALWVEFGNDLMDDFDIVVKVGGKTLTKGYYHLANPEIQQYSSMWEFLGTWTEQEKLDQKANHNVAEWYLVHYGFNEFEIVIPWLTGYTFNGTSTGFEIAYPDGATSVYESPAEVEVTYYASVEPNAKPGTTDDLFNSAYVKWTGVNSTKTSETDTVYTYVDGLSIHKMDSTTHAALAGAEFELFLDEDCEHPLYVIPTDIEGVYIYDDLYADGQKISGAIKETAREVYEEYLAGYLGNATQKNLVVSPVNGKIVVIGLKNGTYYIKEKTPPSGYNSISGAVEIKVGDTTNRFYIYADEQGKVSDIQAATSTYAQKEYIVEEAEIFNSKGIVLPSTGGTGTFWLITIGTIVTIGFAVFLITHKKMSVYND